MGFKLTKGPQSAGQLEADQTSGHDDPQHPKFDTCWFASWWLQRGEFDTGHVLWSTDGEFVRLTRHDDPDFLRVWRLTDERDDHGCVLGVWPD